MYLFKKEFEEVVRLPHLLTFANDLHSGKLHREFHHGPDPGEPFSKLFRWNKTGFVEAEKAAQDALEAAKEIDGQIEETKDEIDEVKEKLEKATEELDQIMEENVKNEKELDQIDGPRAKAAKDNIVNEAIQQEEELLQKEDELYEDSEYESYFVLLSQTLNFYQKILHPSRLAYKLHFILHVYI